jgi:hypothetical protein
MSDIKIQPSATGSATVTLTAPVSNTARTITLPDSTGTLALTTGDDDKLLLTGGAMTGALTVRSSSENVNTVLLAIGNDVHASNTKDAWIRYEASTGGSADQTFAIGAVNNSFRFVHLGTRATAPLSGTELMRIDSTGNLGIGVTPAMASSSYNGLHIGATYPTMKLSSTSSGHAATDGFHLRIDSTPRVEYWNYENTDQVFANNNSEKIRILAGGGITFNGDTAAANALDDYEEGTWTPTITFGGNAAGIAYSTQTGHYTKVGRAVHIYGHVALSSKGSSTGHLNIRGLPKTPAGDYCPVALRFQNLSFADMATGIISSSAPASVLFYETSNGGTETTLTNSNAADNTRILFSCTYFT